MEPSSRKTAERAADNPTFPCPAHPGTVPAGRSSMALKATIYKAKVSFSDLDSNVYADHSVTIARHPSETDERMLVRLLAFALNAPATAEEESARVRQGYLGTRRTQPLAKVPAPVASCIGSMSDNRTRNGCCASPPAWTG